MIEEIHLLQSKDPSVLGWGGQEHHGARRREGLTTGGGSLGPGPGFLDSHSEHYDFKAVSESIPGSQSSATWTPSLLAMIGGNHCTKKTIPGPQTGSFPAAGGLRHCVPGVQRAAQAWRLEATVATRRATSQGPSFCLTTPPKPKCISSPSP